MLATLLKNGSILDYRLHPGTRHELTESLGRCHLKVEFSDISTISCFRTKLFLQKSSSSFKKAV